MGRDEELDADFFGMDIFLELNMKVLIGDRLCRI
jgi:hypothetical protein